MTAAVAMLAAVISANPGRCFTMPQWIGSTLSEEVLASLADGDSQPLTKVTASAVYSSVDGYYERMAALHPQDFTASGATLRNTDSEAFGHYADAASRDLSGDALVLKASAIYDVNNGIRDRLSGNKSDFCLSSATNIAAVSDGEWTSNAYYFATIGGNLRAVYETVADCAPAPGTPPTAYHALASVISNLNAELHGYAIANPSWQSRRDPSALGDLSLEEWYQQTWGWTDRGWGGEGGWSASLDSSHHDCRGYLPLLAKELVTVPPAQAVEATNVSYTVHNVSVAMGTNATTAAVAGALPFFSLGSIPGINSTTNFNYTTNRVVTTSSKFRYGHGETASGIIGMLTVAGKIRYSNLAAVGHGNAAVILLKSPLESPTRAGYLYGRAYHGNRESYVIEDCDVTVTTDLTDVTASLAVEANRSVAMTDSDTYGVGAVPVPSVFGSSASVLDHYGVLYSQKEREDEPTLEWCSFCAKSTEMFEGSPSRSMMLALAAPYQSAAVTEMTRIAGGTQWYNWIGIGDAINTCYSRVRSAMAAEPKYITDLQVLFSGNAIGFVPGENTLKEYGYALNDWPEELGDAPSEPYGFKAELQCVSEIVSPFTEHKAVSVECGPAAVRRLTKHGWGNYTEL